MKVFVIDIAKCNGCYGCQIACKDEHCGNDWMPYARPQPDTGQFWSKVTEYTRGTIPQVRCSFVPELCMHCADAPCIKVCPTHAIRQRRMDWSSLTRRNAVDTGCVWMPVPTVRFTLMKRST